MQRRYRCLQWLGISLMLWVSTAEASSRVETLVFSDGQSLRMVYSAPEHPTAILLMLPGGSGRVGLDKAGQPRHARDFTVRTRADWLARGYAVALPDSTDHYNLRGQRHTQAYAEDVSRIIDRLRQQSSLPIFLIGTSQGSIAALNVAAHVPDIKGIALAESVTVKGRSGETVFDASPSTVSVPVLIVANRQDRCWVAPPDHASRLAAALTASPDVRVMQVDGGTQKSSRACGALSPHGYYGIERTVMDEIDHWLTQQLTAKAHS